MIALCITLALAAQADDPTASVLTQMITVELAEVPGLEVLSDTDVSRVLALEQKRSVMGCEEAEECLAELADAMGTRLVVYGELNKVAGRYFLSLSLFDSEEQKAVGRLIARGNDLPELEAQIVGQIGPKLIGERSFAPGTRAMVLKLTAQGGDTKAGGDTPPPKVEPAQPASLGWLWLSSGAGLALVGAALATPAIIVPIMVSSEEAAFTGGDPEALNRAASLHDTWYGEGNLATIGAAVGGTMVVVGAGLIVLGAFSE